MPSRAEEVLDFWFGREDEPGYGEFRDEWFRKDPEFDARITDQFAGLYEEAAAGDVLPSGPPRLEVAVVVNWFEELRQRFGGAADGR